MWQRLLRWGVEDENMRFGLLTTLTENWPCHSSSFTRQRPSFEPGSSHMGFEVGKEARQNNGKWLPFRMWQNVITVSGESATSISWQRLWYFSKISVTIYRISCATSHGGQQSSTLTKAAKEHLEIRDHRVSVALGFWPGLVVRVPGYTTEMYCASCEVRTEFIYVM
jgi:hypothetical protein